MKKSIFLAAATAAIIGTPHPSFAASDAALEALKQEVQTMRRFYEARIADLESKVSTLQSNKPQTTTKEATKAAVAANRQVYNNDFNPSIGVVLNGKFSSFSEASSEMAGFGVGEEGERGREGIAIDESELNFSGNIDDKFYGSLTAAIVREGGSDIVELEEAYIQTQGGVLPYGLSAKAGRAFWTLGYMNEHHAHADDFADRPLPYRAYLNKAFNDDGAEVSWVLPTDFYSEIGFGAFRGDDFPSGSAGGDDASYSVYGRVGGDIGNNQSWRAGGYYLTTDTAGRKSNEDAVTFIGESDLYIADLRYTWAPTGNAKEKEVTFQGEYFFRDEKGTYEDTNASTGRVAFNDDTSGWYAQAVYKFDPQWRIGARYSQLSSASTPTGLAGSALDASGHDPVAYAAMIDWTNSEFSRFRLQLNQEELSQNVDDTQLILQYTVSLGAHGAHKY